MGVVLGCEPVIRYCLGQVRCARLNAGALGIEWRVRVGIRAERRYLNLEWRHIHRIARRGKKRRIMFGKSLAHRLGNAVYGMERRLMVDRGAVQEW